MVIRATKRSETFSSDIPSIQPNFEPFRETPVLEPTMLPQGLGDFALSATFRQPGVFKLDPKIRMDEGSQSPLLLYLGGASLTAVGMAIARRPGDSVRDTLLGLQVTRDPAARKILMEHILEKAKTDPSFISILLNLASDPKVYGEGIRERIQNLDIHAWEDPAKTDSSALRQLRIMAVAFNHEGAREILSRLDLSGYREELAEDYHALFYSAEDLFYMAELGNAQAWEILGEADLPTLDEILEEYRSGGDNRDEALTALKTLIYIARGSGEQRAEAMKRVQRFSNLQTLLRIEDIPAALFPLLQMGNKEAISLATFLDLSDLKAMGRHLHPKVRGVHLYRALEVVLPYSEDKASFAFLTLEAEKGNTLAIQTLDHLRSFYYRPAENYLRWVALGFASKNTRQVLRERFENPEASREHPATTLLQTVLEHPRMKSMDWEADWKSRLGKSMSKGLVEAWRQEAYKNYYLEKSSSETLSAHLIPRSYINAYFKRLSTNPGDLFYGSEELPDEGEVPEARPALPTLPPLEVEPQINEDVENRLILKLNFETIGKLSEEQNQDLQQQIIEAWDSLPLEEKEAFVREKDEESIEIPSSFVRALVEQRPALFRPWSDEERGEDWKDTKKPGPKGKP